jgi:hypothetical protein
MEQSVSLSWFETLREHSTRTIHFALASMLVEELGKENAGEGGSEQAKEQEARDSTFGGRVAYC